MKRKMNAFGCIRGINVRTGALSVGMRDVPCYRSRFDRQNSCKLPRDHRVRRRQPTVDAYILPIDIARVVRSQE